MVNVNTAFADEDVDLGIPTSALHNIETEQALLGAIISQREALSKVDTIITPEDFYEPLHREIYAKFLSIRDEGCEPTYQLVLVKLGALRGLTVEGRTMKEYAALLARE